MKILAATLASFALVAPWQPLTFAQPGREANDASLLQVAALQQTLENVIASAEPAVVAISRRGKSQTQQESSTSDLFSDLRSPRDTKAKIVASGVIIDPDGYVLTEYRAVREGDDHFVTTKNGITYRAAIKGADPRSALAVLDISPRDAQNGDQSPGEPVPLRSLPIGDSATLRKGHFVVAIGNPFAIESDGEPTASWGIVSNLARKAPTGANLNDAPGPAEDLRTTMHHLGTLIQTDAKLGWSAGGGALVNLHGELVGITTSLATIAGYEHPAGYAIPIDGEMRRVIETLKAGREVEYGMLGVTFGFVGINVDSSSQTQIHQVYSGSPADDAGLQAGDVVTAVGQMRVADIDAVQLAVSRHPPGSTIEIHVLRDGRPTTAQVKLAKLATVGKRIVTQQPEAVFGIRVDHSTALDALELSQAISGGLIDPAGCVQVREVEPESPAWEAGIRPGMFISHVGIVRVTKPEEYYERVQHASSVTELRLTQPLPGPGRSLPRARPTP